MLTLKPLRVYIFPLYRLYVMYIFYFRSSFDVFHAETSCFWIKKCKSYYALVNFWIGTVQCSAVRAKMLFSSRTYRFRNATCISKLFLATKKFFKKLEELKALARKGSQLSQIFKILPVSSKDIMTPLNKTIMNAFFRIFILR